MTISWETRALTARKTCGMIWPKIAQLRAELRTWESVHGYFELIGIEADRHLVQVIQLPRSATIKGPEKKAEMLLDKAVKLSPEQRRRLILALEGKG